MTASNETTNYKLPLFTDDDQPTWLGDFNGAMNKIDTDMDTIGANASTALSAANNAVNRVGQVETTIAGVQTTANNAYALSTTNEKGIGALNGEVAILNNKFPVATSDIATAAITAEKLNSTAIKAVWAAQRVYHFASEDSTADNTGMSVPSNCYIAGYFFAELGLLLLYKMFMDGPVSATATITLPSYVPAANSDIRQSVGVIHWNASNDFRAWGSLKIAKGTRIISVTARQSGDSTDLNGAQIIYMGTTQQATSTASYAEANGLL